MNTLELIGVSSGDSPTVVRANASNSHLSRSTVRGRIQASKRLLGYHFQPRRGPAIIVNPSASMAAIVLERDGKPVVAVLRTSDLKLLSVCPASQPYPIQWSPHGDRLAFLDSVGAVQAFVVLAPPPARLCALRAHSRISCGRRIPHTSCFRV